MIIDARTVSSATLFETDLCVLGAGAAGIAIAREFDRTDIRVMVLESGGLKFNHRTQFLYRGEQNGRPYTPLEFTRRRQFGGSTTTWFGRCHPLDATDFEKRDWLSYSGWPISAEDMAPYYQKAGPIFELPQDLTLPNDGLQPHIELKPFQFSPPTRFGQFYRAELERSANIQVILHANVTHIQLAADGNEVVEVHAATLTSRSFTVRAKIFVVALGGLETTRLLLASRDVHPNGVGNQHDLLGRFFMDHVSLFDAVLEEVPLKAPPNLFKLDYSVRQEHLGNVLAVSLPEEYRSGHNLLNACGFFVRRPAHKTDDLFFSKAFQNFIKISDVFHHMAPPSPNMIVHVLKLFRHSPALARMIMNRIKRRFKNAYGLQMQLECAPNPESRLTLSRQRDALGMPRLHLDWKLTQQDLDSYLRSRLALQERLTAAGFRVRLIRHELDEEGWPVSIVSSKHPMGTTRMHKQSSAGVVDEHCCVHGVHNLYIASSSTFPTSGMANPTLTIAALSLRIADTVRRRFQG